MKENITINDIKIRQVKDLRNKLNFHQILYFIAISNCRSLSHAAKLLGIGQPGLSQQIQKLEEDVGQALFVKSRGRGGIQLTDFGQFLLSHAEKLQQEGLRFLEAMENRESYQKSFKIGASPSSSKAVLERLAHRMIEDPLKKISLVEAEAQTLQSYLESEHIDYLITDRPPHRVSSQLVVEKLFESPIYVCARESLFNGRLSKSFFESCPLIFPGPDSPLSQGLDRYFQQKGWVANIHAEIQDTSLQLSLARQGHGAVFVGDASRQELLNSREGEQIVTTQLGGLRQPLYLCHYSQAAAESVLSYLRG